MDSAEGFEMVESNDGFCHRFGPADSADYVNETPKADKEDEAASEVKSVSQEHKECVTNLPECVPIPCAPPAGLPGTDATTLEGEHDCTVPDESVELREEWTQSECHMQDIRYAEQPKPELPHYKIKSQLKVLVVGQAETGKSLLIRNLFASYTRDGNWTPIDVFGLTEADFHSNPSKFQTTIDGIDDANDAHLLTFIIQEAPPLEGSPSACAAMLLRYIDAQKEDFLKQEQDLSLKRSLIRDSRVDVCLYTLPTNRRYSAFDLAVIRALGTVVPTIPVMCKADCMTSEEVKARRLEMEKLVQEGLPIFQFPEGTGNSASANGSVPKVACPPFIVMAGNESDESVHPFWFVRKYRWGTCEAYREVDSDMKQLRQLMLEDGFFALKDAADEKLRRQVSAARVSEDKAAHMVEVPGDGGASSSPVAAPPTPCLQQEPVATAEGTHADQSGDSWFEAQDAAPAAEGKVGGGVDVATDVDSDRLDAAAGLAFDEGNFYQAEIKGVLRTSSGSNYRLTLHVPEIDKVLCMRIGSMEGSNLLNLLDNVPNGRPSTYDTWKAMMDMTGCRMVRALITHCADTVFYGRIQSEGRGGEAMDVDARPSDAFNMALRCGASIWLSKEVADTFAKHPSKHVWPLGERRTT